MEKKNENLKYILTRFDNYINASNVKGTFIISLNTFIIGVILVNKNTIADLFCCNQNLLNIFNVILFLICLSGLGIIFFAIKALFPYMNSGNEIDEVYHSHIYFGSISKFENKQKFLESFNNLIDPDFEKDLEYQIYTISKGLKKKYEFLNKAMYILYFELVLFLLIFILIAFR